MDHSASLMMQRRGMRQLINFDWKTRLVYYFEYFIYFFNYPEGTHDVATKDGSRFSLGLVVFLVVSVVLCGF